MKSERSELFKNHETNHILTNTWINKFSDCPFNIEGKTLQKDYKVIFPV